MKRPLLAHTRIDVLFEVSQLAQVTESFFNADPKKELKTLNCALKYVHKNPEPIVFPKFESMDLRIIGFSDASFANNRDNSTHLGFIIFKVVESNYFVPIHFSSNKARRIVRSVLGVELIAFVIRLTIHFLC